MEMWKCHMQGKQLPIPDEDSVVFWEGCRRQRLLIQQCDICKHFRFPPSPLCPRCLSSATTWQDDPGTGEVLTFCVYHSAIAGPAWEAEVPYIVAVISLAYSGVKILSNLICDEIDFSTDRIASQSTVRSNHRKHNPPQICPMCGSHCIGQRVNNDSKCNKNLQ